ncbi:MAG: sel1 repeat family protein [bacterium]|nr:sel1 repeat family protein [bacterium]
MQNNRNYLILLIVAFAFIAPSLAEADTNAWEIIIPQGVYSDNTTYDSIAPYTAYENGKKALSENNPNGYAMLASSAKRGCNQARMILAQIFMPADHELNSTHISIVPENGDLTLADRLEKYQQYMRQAADNNSTTAAKLLVILYSEGKYVPKNMELVFKYAKICALQKDPDGMFELGYLYSKGWGCQKDRAAAVKWMKNAAHAGSEEAKEWIEDRRGHYTYSDGCDTYKISSTQALREYKQNHSLSSDEIVGIYQSSYADMRRTYCVLYDGVKTVTVFYPPDHANVGDIIKYKPCWGCDVVDDCTRTRTVKKWKGPKIGGWEDLLK